MKNIEHVEQWCKEYHIKSINRSQYHVSVIDGSNRLDIYFNKKGMKYHDVTKKKRGAIGRLIEFLDCWLEGSTYKEPPLFDVLLDLYHEYFNAQTIVKKNYAQIKIETILKYKLK